MSLCLRKRKMSSRDRDPNCGCSQMDIDVTTDQARVALLVESIRQELLTLDASDVIHLRAVFHLVIDEYLREKMKKKSKEMMTKCCCCQRPRSIESPKKKARNDPGVTEFD